MTRIKCGTKVTWNNWSGGYGREKTGILLAFVPKQANVFQEYPNFQNIPKSRHKFTNRESLSADRYLVEVQRSDKSGKVLESHFYCPFAGVVERQN